MQLINIYTLGNPDGVGVFFPDGLVGNINSPAGYMNMATGLEDFPASPMDAYQVSAVSLYLYTILLGLPRLMQRRVLTPAFSHGVTCTW